MKKTLRGAALFGLSVCVVAALGCQEETSAGADDGGVAGGGGSGGAAGADGTGGPGGADGADGIGGMGGVAGEDGADGTAGVDGGGDDPCGAGITVLELTDGQADGEGWTLQGNTSGQDDFAGSCAGEGQGADAVIHFQAPAAGFWSFSTVDGADFDTVIFALEDCNDGFSEVACNDDAGGDVQSEIVFELAAEQDIFVVVDTFAPPGSEEGMAPNPFTLRAQPVDATAPVIESATAAYNPDNNALALTVDGTDPENDIVRVRLTLIDAGGQVIGDPVNPGIVVDFEGAGFATLEQADGRFHATLAGALGEQISGVAALDLAMGDRVGLWSADFRVDAAPPQQVARGEECDPSGAYTLCGEEDACMDVDEDGTFNCVLATPPTLVAAEAFVNAEGGVMGVRVEGTDPENNAFYVEVLPLGAEGAEMPLGDGGPAGFVLEYVEQADGAFQGFASFNAAFMGECLPPAQAEFDRCTQAGGDQDTCVDQANELLRQCGIDRLALVETVRVWVGDDTGRRSDPLDVPIGPTEVGEANSVCDSLGAITSCPEELVCFNIAAADAAPICQEAQAICPAGWEVVNLNDHAGEQGWVFEGDSTGFDNHGGGGSCGGGGPNAVHAFTAPAAGNYIVTLDAAPGSDTVLFARTHCALPQADYELACNDDRAQGDLLSAVAVELEAEQTVYLFADGYQGSFAGPYVIAVQSH